MSVDMENTLGFFNFNDDHEAIVLDNSEFESKGKVKVYQPELFVGQIYDDLEDRKVGLNRDQLINRNNLELSGSISTVNYIECYPFVWNFLAEVGHKPDIGETVVLKFVNGDPKLPYYINGHYYFNQPDETDPDVDPNPNFRSYGYKRIIKLVTPNMYGSDVNILCKKLVSLGFSILKVNKRYEYTKQVNDLILEFQKLVDIYPDGEVGPITYNALQRRTEGWISEV